MKQHPADRIARLFVAVGSAMTYLGTEASGARNRTIAAELDDARTMLDDARKGAVELATRCYLLGHEHGRDGTPPVDDPAAAVIEDQGAAAAGADEDQGAAAAAADEDQGAAAAGVDEHQGDEHPELAHSAGVRPVAIIGPDGRDTGKTIWQRLRGDGTPDDPQ